MAVADVDQLVRVVRAGTGAKLGDFKGRVVGIGPQFSIIHRLSPSWEAFLNVRTYGEFAAKNRTSGFVMFVTYVLSHKAQPKAAGVE